MKRFKYVFYIYNLVYHVIKMNIFKNWNSFFEKTINYLNFRNHITVLLAKIYIKKID